jgi:colanic acid biosynthesis glycosyl transferase WcaI
MLFSAPFRDDRVRILIITQYFWPESFKVNDLARGLQARGHSVEVLTGMPNYPAGRYFDGYRATSPLREDYHGIPVHRVPLVPRGAGRALRLAFNYGSYAILASLRLLPWGPRRRFDVAFVFEISPVTQILPAILLRRLGRVPFAVWVQDLWPESVTTSGLVRRPAVVGAIRRLSRWLYRSADLLLGSSEAFLPRLQALGASPDRLRYAPNWAEDVFDAPAERPAHPEPWEGGFPVVFAGNLGRVQGLETVLDAAERLRDEPDVRWVLAGDGSLRAWLVDEARRRGLSDRVHFLGRRPLTEMPSLFARAGALLVSLAPDEVVSLTIPAKLQTYLAAGRPVLGCIDGEAARVIRESGAGLASAAGDAAALAENVVRMARLPAAERDRMGARGRAYCQAHFERSICLDRIEEALSQLAAGGAP